jgi:hypothetical protein
MRTEERQEPPMAKSESEMTPENVLKIIEPEQFQK